MGLLRSYNTTLSKTIKTILSESEVFIKKNASVQKIDFSKYPEIIQKICSYYKLKTCNDLEEKTEHAELINRKNHGNISLLRELHDELFKVMTSTNDVITESTPNVIQKPDFSCALTEESS